MKAHRFALLLGLALASLTITAKERLPIEDFARTPDTTEARLSPDGRYLAFIRDYAGRPLLHVAKIDAQYLSRLDLGEATLLNDAPKSVGDYDWVGDQRLMITTVARDSIYGVIAADIDGSRAVPLGGYEDEKIDINMPKLFAREVIHRFFDASQRVLVLDRHEASPGSRNRPDVLSLDTSSGLARVVLKNPGEVGAWGVDAAGVVRLGILTHGDQTGAIYRETEKAPWRTILPLQDRRGGLRPVGFDSSRNQIFIAALTEQRRWAIYSMDPATGDIGSPLFSDPEYDILPQRYIPSINGHSLATPIFSPQRDALLGVRYITDAPRVKWFDREFARMQQAVDHASPDTVNLLIDVSRDGTRMLWFGYSDQNPGVYYLADVKQHSLKLLARRMGWIKPAQMAQTLAVKYTARDGLVIHGFLSVPVGHQPKDLPLVVMPHGGPWVRDVWGFDPMVQLLANRGYAVLQMNYRGSPGYGDELYTNAKRQVGRQIQDDIEDATRWAIAAGVADPKRIAILGMSYGGYSTLFALGHNPELYRCGISFAGVTDWPTIYNSSDATTYKAARLHWQEQIGDPTKDADFLKAISPVYFADKITAPLLIIQGKDDRRVPPDQAKRMIAALEKVGRKPESLFISGLGHNLGREKQRIEIMKAMAAFLEKNLGPGVE